MTPRSVAFTYSVVASPLHDADAVARITAGPRDLIEQCRGEPVVGVGRPDLPHAVLVATGGTERACLDLVEQRAGIAPGIPTVLLAHGGHNSLPAALETLAALHQRGRRGRIVWMEGASAAPDLAEIVADVAVLHRLHDTTIGLVGGASDWLVASSPDPALVTATWGPTVRTIEPSSLTDPRPAGSPVAVRLTERFGTGSRGSEVPESEVAAAAEVASTLTALVDEEELDAVAVRCFDLLSTVETSGCLALAALNDDRVVAGCEGDLPSTLGMLLVRELLDQPAWMANPARVDPAAERLELAHCTIAPSMVRDYHLATHFESGIGVGIGGHFDPQAVTLIRIGGTGLDRRWIAEGRIVASGDDADLCRTQATVELDDRSVEELLRRPLGNHVVLTAGHHRARIERWWSLAFGD